MRVLLIEDDPSTASSIVLTLAVEGIICDTAEVGIGGVEISKVCDYDIVILDVMLPDIDGYEVLLRLRSARIKVPVLILSGLSGVEQKIKGLGLGADDYMTKPYNRRELIARIQAIVRRSKGHSESVIRFDKVAVHLEAGTVEVDGVPLHLTQKEYKILSLLATRKGSTVKKEVFLRHLYQSTEEPEIKIIDVFVCKLRKKLSKACGGVDYIKTVWGVGYALNDYAEVNDSQQSNTLNNSSEHSGTISDDSENSDTASDIEKMYR